MVDISHACDYDGTARNTGLKSHKLVSQDKTMTSRNEFNQRDVRMIRKVGAELRTAREAMRLSIREAASRTVTSRGHMSYQTWRRVEMGYIETSAGNVTYRPMPETLVAMAEVVGLDGDELCKRLKLEPPPKRVPQAPRGELEEIREALMYLAEKVAQFEREHQ